jgi:hypothetical protein
MTQYILRLDLAVTTPDDGGYDGGTLSRSAERLAEHLLSVRSLNFTINAVESKVIGQDQGERA